MVALCLIFGAAEGMSGHLITPALGVYCMCRIIQWTPVKLAQRGLYRTDCTAAVDESRGLAA